MAGAWRTGTPNCAESPSNPRSKQPLGPFPTCLPNTALLRGSPRKSVHLPSMILLTHRSPRGTLERVGALPTAHHAGPLPIPFRCRSLGLDPQTPRAPTHWSASFSDTHLSSPRLRRITTQTPAFHVGAGGGEPASAEPEKRGQEAMPALQLSPSPAGACRGWGQHHQTHHRTPRRARHAPQGAVSVLPRLPQAGWRGRAVAVSGDQV